jgi:hypothetical protein
VEKPLLFPSILTLKFRSPVWEASSTGWIHSTSVPLYMCLHLLFLWNTDLEDHSRSWLGCSSVAEHCLPSMARPWSHPHPQHHKKKKKKPGTLLPFFFDSPGVRTQGLTLDRQTPHLFLIGTYLIFRVQIFFRYRFMTLKSPQLEL